MTGRPCRPSADLKRMWRTLLPGTPFPTCGTPDETEAGGEAGPDARRDPAPQGRAVDTDQGDGGPNSR